MKFKTLTKRIVQILPILAIVLFTSPAFAHAASFVSNETVANVTLGTDLQATATTSSTTNVSQVKAVRTVTVASVPANAVTLTIGSCVVTFNTGASPDSDCSNNNAAIDTTAASTTATVATALRALTGVTATGHGALTTGGSALTASFTTTGTETSATNIAAVLSSGSSITLTTVDTTGVVPVAQVWLYTPSNVEAGDTFTATINGTPVSFTATTSTVANVTAGLTAAINASAVASAVTAADLTTSVRVTADVAGTAFTLVHSNVNRPAVAQTVTFTPSDIVNGDFTITINDVPYTVRPSASATVQEVVEAITPVVDADDAVSCTEDDTKITCIASSAGTPFTYSSGVTNITVADNSGSSHHGSGGGSSNSSSSGASSTASLQAMLTTLKAKIAALLAAKGNTTASAAVSGIFMRDLDLGATGEDARALQKYLNGKGFTVSVTGAGSVGNETALFGAATREALAKFQASVGISPAAGYFGPKTRAYVESHP